MHRRLNTNHYSDMQRAASSTVAVREPGSEDYPSLHTRNMKVLKYLVKRGYNAQLDLDFLCKDSLDIQKAHLLDYLEVLSSAGLDIQPVTSSLSGLSKKRKKTIVSKIERLNLLKTKQLDNWHLAEVISSAGLLKDLKILTKEKSADERRSSLDRQRKSLVEVAALNDRGDVILWLWYRFDLSQRSKGDKMNKFDVLQLCRKNGWFGAASAIEHIASAEKIGEFCGDNFKRLRTIRTARRRVAAVTLIQKRVRGWLVYRRYRDKLKSVHGSRAALQTNWGPLTTLLKDISDLMTAVSQFSWIDVKLRHDLAIDMGEEYTAQDRQEINELLLSAANITPSDGNKINEEEREVEDAMECDYQIAIDKARNNSSQDIKFHSDES